jgi:hypothetical protein
MSFGTLSTERKATIDPDRITEVSRRLSVTTGTCDAGDFNPEGTPDVIAPR